MKNKNFLKRMAAAVTVLAMSVLMAACTASGSSASSAVQATSVASTTQNTSGKAKIGLVQLLENGAFEDMKDGFVSQMAKLGYTEGENLEIIYKNAQGDMGVLNSICQNFVDQKVDMIVSIATPPAQIALSTLQNNKSDIPLVFISVSDPVTAGLVTSLEETDKNATGTTNYIPIEDNFKLADKLTPGIETYGFLYTSGEVNAVSTVKEAKDYCDANGIKYVEKVVSNSSEIQQAAAALVEKCDALFIPNDSVVQSAMPQISTVAMKAKIPVYGSSAVMVDAGAFATISAGDFETGVASAEIAFDILQGTPANEIPVTIVKDYMMVINEDTANAIGVTVPQDILDEAVVVKGIK